MKRGWIVVVLLAATLWPFSCGSASAGSGPGEICPPRVTWMEAGTRTSSPGYWMPPQDGVDLCGYISGIEAERDALRAAWRRERAAAEGMRVAGEAHLVATEELRETYENLDRAHRKEAQAAKTGWGLGIGAGWDAIGHEAVISIGFVWRIVPF